MLGANLQVVGDGRDPKHLRWTDSTYNILTIAYFYPPDSKPRAVQVARLLSASTSNKLVFCGSAGDAGELIPDEENHVRVHVAWSVPRWRKAVHSVAMKMGGPFGGTWEPYRPWQRRVIAAVQKSLQESAFEPDVIATFGHPWIDHEIGLTLKRMLGIPWVAHFSDPWVDNPLVGFSSAAARDALRRRESAVLSGADRVIFTSQETVDLVMTHYPAPLRDRIVVLPHSFDARLFPEAAPIDTGVIRCLGKFYGARKPDVLIDALRLIRRERPDALSGCRFELVGNYVGPPGADATLPPEIRFRPAVPYLSSLRLMASAEALFLIDAPAEKSIFLPSKLIEYIGSERPIFGITPPGTSDSLIRRYGGMTADPTDLGEVADMICRFLDHRSEISMNQTVRGEFAMESVGRRFDAIVRGCLNPSVSQAGVEPGTS